MQMLLIIFFLLGSLIFPCFLCVSIILALRKQWKWLLLTLVNTLLWIPGLALWLYIMPKDFVFPYTYCRLWVLLIFCWHPLFMLLSAFKTNNRLLIAPAVIAVIMNISYIFLVAFFITACALGA